MTDAAAASRILTLVFTDLADSMALKMQRGDQSAGELMARHRAHTSQLAAQGVGRIGGADGAQWVKFVTKLAQYNVFI